MTNVVPKTKLLVVDPSPSMAQVLKTFADLHDYDADVFSDSAEACAALANRFSNHAPGGGYDCVVLGWPKGQVGLVAGLLGALASVENSDLPLIVLSDEPDKDVQTLARRRAKTRTLLWRDHTRIEGLVEGMVVKEAAAVEAPARPQLRTVQSPVHHASASAQRSKNILLVDDTPSVCHALRDMLESDGYSVTIANSASEARKAVAVNRYDLVLTEFFLPGESGEDLCRYLNSLHSAWRPVYALMTRKNIDSIVQRSLAVGAITCLDKSESTGILFARLDAIAKRISSGDSAAQSGAATSGTSTASTATDAAASVAHLMQSSVAPTVLIDSRHNIVAANTEAAFLLASGDEKALPAVSFEKKIHAAPVLRSTDQPVKAMFHNLAGEKLSVVYRSRDINGAKYGIDDDVCLLAFESVDEKKVPETASAGMTTAPVTKQSVLKNMVREPVQSGSKLPEFEGKPEPVFSQQPAAVMLNTAQMERVIDKALASKPGGVTSSLLMIDIKMVAAATGDRLSLGAGKQLLELVKGELARQYTRKDSLSYHGDGRFVLLFESGNARQAYALAEKLVALVPELIDGLSGIKLLSHAAFIKLPHRPDISARYLLQHCAAACLKMSIEGMDNNIFDINANDKLPPRRTTGKPLSVASAAGIDVATESSAGATVRSAASS